MTQFNRNIEVLQSKQDVAQQAAEEFVAVAARAIEQNGSFSVALSGGSTPISMYKVLREGPMSSQVEWQRLIFFWSDERCVPPGDPESNYGAAARELLDHIVVPEVNVHRLRGEMDPDASAREYEVELTEWVRGEPPSFDLLMLGMGDDGHTASLFPGTEAVGITDRLVTPNYVPKLNANRLSFTRTLINAAKEVLVLVTGDEKADALREVLEGERDETKYPAQIINPSSGTALWLVDRAAASKLSMK